MVDKLPENCEFSGQFSESFLDFAFYETWVFFSSFKAKILAGYTLYEFILIGLSIGQD